MTKSICVVAIIVALFGKVAPAQADEVDDKQLSESIKGVITLLEKEHVLHIPVDDAISRKWFANFFASLDPKHMYFLESDLREFHSYESRLDDLGRAGDVRFPKLVWNRFCERVTEAATLAKSSIVADHNFNLDEEIPLDYEYFAIDRDAWKERWRLRIKYELLIEQTFRRPLNEVQKQLNQRYERIERQAKEMPDTRLQRYFTRSLAIAIDPHCDYFNELWRYRSGWLKLRLGIFFDSDSMRNLVSDVDPKLKEIGNAVIGHELIAIQSLDGQIYDVVELPFEGFSSLPFFEMVKPDREGEVILHLWNARQLRRTVVSWPLLLVRP